MGCYKEVASPGQGRTLCLPPGARVVFLGCSRSPGPGRTNEGCHVQPQTDGWGSNVGLVASSAPCAIFCEELGWGWGHPKTSSVSLTRAQTLRSPDTNLYLHPVQN